MSSIIFIPLFEEKIVRGVLPDAFAVLTGKATAIFISSLLFALMHPFTNQARPAPLPMAPTVPIAPRGQAKTAIPPASINAIKWSVFFA